jgi:crossover junction endodeoxyribonuclease RuvC
MRILGIDPGLRTTGFGVVEKHGNQLLYVASGTIKTNKEAQGNLAERLKVLFDGIHEVVDRYKPETSAVEIAVAGPSTWGMHHRISDLQPTRR